MLLWYLHVTCILSAHIYIRIHGTCLMENCRSFISNSKSFTVRPDLRDNWAGHNLNYKLYWSLILRTLCLLVLINRRLSLAQNANHLIFQMSTFHFVLLIYIRYWLGSHFACPERFDVAGMAITSGDCIRILTSLEDGDDEDSILNQTTIWSPAPTDQWIGWRR